MSYVTTSVNPITLGDGRTVAVDEPVGRIDPKDPVNAALIEAGRLIEVKAKSQPKAEKEKN